MSEHLPFTSEEVASNADVEGEETWQDIDQAIRNRAWPARLDEDGK